MPTVINVYDTVASIGVNDPEASITVYEMFIGVGPTGPTGATGPAGAAAVAGVLPSEYVEMATPRTVTSATLVDITGVTADIVLDSTVNIAVFMDCEVSSDGLCDLGLAISINGTDHAVTTVHLNGTTDDGKVTVIHRTATPLAAGTYTVKGRFLRNSGTATPQVDRADFLVFGLQGAAGAAGADGVDGVDGVDSTITVATDATSDMIFGVANAWAKKTLAEGKTILGITNSPNVATTAASDTIMGDGAGAWVKKTKAETKTALDISDVYFTVVVVPPLTGCAVADGVIEFPIPAKLNNYNLAAVTGFVNTAGTTGTMDVQIRNKTDTTDMLSTKMTFDSTETSTLTAATPSVVDATHDDVVTNDIIAVDIDVIQTTAAKGLYILFKWSPQ